MKKTYKVFLGIDYEYHKTKDSALTKRGQLQSLGYTKVMIKARNY